MLNIIELPNTRSYASIHSSDQSWSGFYKSFQGIETSNSSKTLWIHVGSKSFLSWSAGRVHIVSGLFQDSADCAVVMGCRIQALPMWFALQFVSVSMNHWMTADSKREKSSKVSRVLFMQQTFIWKATIHLNNSQKPSLCLHVSSTICCHVSRL